MSADGTIKRRRRLAAPQPLAPGERKNVTFLASAETYNILVEASQNSGRSISELLEIHMNKNGIEKLRPKFEDIFFGSPQSMKLLVNYALILATYDQQTDWRENEAARAGILAAFEMLNNRFFPVDMERIGPNADMSDPRTAELNTAWNVGLRMGALMAGPLAPAGEKSKKD